MIGVGLVLLIVRPAGAQVARGLLSVLQPGGYQTGEVFPDGFATAFAEERGWWSRANPVTAWKLDVTREHFEPITDRLTRGEGAAFDRLDYGQLTAPAVGNRVRWTGAVRIDRPAWTSTVSGGDGATRLTGRSTAVGGALRVTGLLSGLSLQVSAPLWSDGVALPGTPFGAGLRFAGSSRWAVQISHTAAATDQNLFARVLDEPVDARLNLSTKVSKAAGRVRLWRWFTVEARWRQTDFAPHQPVDDREIYELEPAGQSRGWSAGLVFAPTSRHDLTLKFTDHDLEVEADGQWGGQQFARLNYCRASLRSQLLGWRWRPGARTAVQMEFENVDLSAQGRGNLESWPFTSTVVDLLGVKKVFRAEGEVALHRLSAWATLAPGRGHLRAGVSWFDLKPQGSLTSWRPAFLVFGSADREYTELDVTRVRMASLLLEARIPVGPHHGLVSLQQFVWGNVNRRTATADDTGPDAEAPGPVSRDGWRGGTFLIVGFVLSAG